MPKVSIITPCYNCEDFIEKTYQCVSSQTHTNWEWICVDDCSRDSSYKILEELQKKDQRVKLFKNPQNLGAAITRNNALDNATGDYTAFLDSDDLWSNEKLEKQINFMQENQLRFSYHDYDLINQNNEVLKTQITPKKMVANDLLKYNPFATSSIIIHASITDKLRFKEHLRRRQDYIYWFEALKSAHQSIKLALTLSSYRIQSNTSLSQDKKKMAIIQWRILKTEFNLNIFTRVYYFTHYALHGIKKYFG